MFPGCIHSSCVLLACCRNLMRLDGRAKAPLTLIVTIASTSSRLPRDRVLFVLTMPPKTIKDFFKPYIVPRSSVPLHDDVEEEIVVATSPNKRRVANEKSRKPASASPLRRHAVQKTTSLRSGSSTPKRAVKVRHAIKSECGVKLDRVEDDDDSDLFHHTPTTARQRTMSLVSIPSPRAAVLVPPSPLLPSTSLHSRPSSAKPNQPATTATTSFSSISTMTTNPLSSQQSSSRRVLKHGFQAVTNSDSGSDDDDELPDVMTFVPRKKPRLTPPKAPAVSIDLTEDGEGRPSTRPSDHLRSARQSERRSGRSTPRRLPSPPKTVYKHSLLKLVKQNEKQAKSAQKIAELEASMAEEQERREEQEREYSAVDVDALAANGTLEGEEGERMMAAMKRTDALQSEVELQFFVKDAKPVAQRTLFPTNALPNERWARCLKDEQSRQQACLTDFVSEVAKRHALPEEAVKWFANQLVHEEREELCEAYVEIIRVSASRAESLPHSLATLRSFYRTHSRKAQPPTISPRESPLSSAEQPDIVNCICGFDDQDSGLVACDACDTWQHATCYFSDFDEEDSLPDDLRHTCISCKPREIDRKAAHVRKRKLRRLLSTDDSEVKDTAPQGLRYVVRVMQYSAPTIGIDAVGTAIAELALANTDETINHSILSLSLQIQTSIAALAASLSDVDAVTLHNEVRRALPLVSPELTDTQLAHVISTFPATNAATHSLRRLLALSLVTRCHDSESLYWSRWPSLVLRALRTHPAFVVAEGMDYSLLIAMVAVLDIAVDAGFTSDYAQLDGTPNDAGGVKKPALFGKHAPVSAAEELFNAQIDAISEQLTFMSSRVKDAGAQHLTRTEAKSALERLVIRLGCAVRTKAKLKKGVFDEALPNEREGMRDIMRAWVGAESGCKDVKASLVLEVDAAAGASEMDGIARPEDQLLSL